MMGRAKEGLKKRSNRNRSFGFWLGLLAVSFVTALILYLDHRDRADTEESITYFPDDPTLSFLEKNTRLLLQRSEPSRYDISWLASSRTNRAAYLRQDVSFLFSDRRLVAIANKWKTKTAEIHQAKIERFHEAGVLEAITVHHAETHGQNGIRGKLAMSYDHLAVMPGDDGAFSAFRFPIAEKAKVWYRAKTQALNETMDAIIKKASSKHRFRPEAYDAFPLTYLHVFANQSLPGLNQKKTNKVIGQLWEGLYKEYALGVRRSDGRIESPIDSFMPIILYSKRHDHLLVVIRLASGEIALLKQNI